MPRLPFLLFLSLLFMGQARADGNLCLESTKYSRDEALALVAEDMIRLNGELDKIQAAQRDMERETQGQGIFSALLESRLEINQIYDELRQAQIKIIDGSGKLKVPSPDMKLCLLHHKVLAALTPKVSSGMQNLSTLDFSLVDKNPYANDREGNSGLLDEEDRSFLTKASKRLSKEKLHDEFLTAIQQNPCEANFRKAWRLKLADYPLFQRDEEMFLRALRYFDFIDDVALGILLDPKATNCEHSRLKDYLERKSFLREQFPLKDKARSNYVAKISKDHLTNRQRLFARYNEVQIKLMSDIIVKLRKRLESPKVEMDVYDSDNKVIDTIDLDPMERFRFAIRVLRKEMRLLAANPNFSKTAAPKYEDLITAAFEVGVVTAGDVDAVAKLEEIWDPRRTLWEKSQYWVKAFGGALSTAVPTPFGFIPTITVVAIEALASKHTVDHDTSDSIF